jgi:hypothetical protein
MGSCQMHVNYVGREVSVVERGGVPDETWEPDPQGYASNRHDRKEPTMADWRKVKLAVFARHSNPWSAWTRWASAPLILVPVWRRSWRDAALVGV